MFDCSETNGYNIPRDAVLTKLTLTLVEGREDPNATISDPSLARLQNAIEMAFRRRVDDGPTLNAGLVAL